MATLYGSGKNQTPATANTNTRVKTSILSDQLASGRFKTHAKQALRKLKTRTWRSNQTTGKKRTLGQFFNSSNLFRRNTNRRSNNNNNNGNNKNSKEDKREIDDDTELQDLNHTSNGQPKTKRRKLNQQQTKKENDKSKVKLNENSMQLNGNRKSKQKNEDKNIQKLQQNAKNKSKMNQVTPKSSQTTHTTQTMEQEFINDESDNDSDTHNMSSNIMNEKIDDSDNGNDDNDNGNINGGNNGSVDADTLNGGDGMGDNDNRSINTNGKHYIQASLFNTLNQRNNIDENDSMEQEDEDLEDIVIDLDAQNKFDENLFSLDELLAIVAQQQEDVKKLKGESQQHLKYIQQLVDENEMYRSEDIIHQAQLQPANMRNAPTLQYALQKQQHQQVATEIYKFDEEFSGTEPPEEVVLYYNKIYQFVNGMEEFNAFDESHVGLKLKNLLKGEAKRLYDSVHTRPLTFTEHMEWFKNHFVKNCELRKQLYYQLQCENTYNVNDTDKLLQVYDQYITKMDLFDQTEAFSTPYQLREYNLSEIDHCYNIYNSLPKLWQNEIMYRNMRNVPTHLSAMKQSLEEVHDILKQRESRKEKLENARTIHNKISNKRTSTLSKQMYDGATDVGGNRNNDNNNNDNSTTNDLSYMGQQPYKRDGRGGRQRRRNNGRGGYNNTGNRDNNQNYQNSDYQNNRGGRGGRGNQRVYWNNRASNQTYKPKAYYFKTYNCNKCKKYGHSENDCEWLKQNRWNWITAFQHRKGKSGNPWLKPRNEKGGYKSNQANVVSQSQTTTDNATKDADIAKIIELNCDTKSILQSSQINYNELSKEQKAQIMDKVYREGADNGDWKA